MVDKKVWKRVKVTFINPNISCDVTLGIYTFQKSSNTITNYFYKVPGQKEWWPIEIDQLTTFNRVSLQKKLSSRL